MMKRELAPGVIRYQFGPEPGKHFANSIVALIDNGQVLLIDTGYEDQAKQVLEDLQQNDLTLAKIIITHFHGDHMDGLKVLPKVPVYGSAKFIVTLNLWYDQEVHQYYTPDHLIQEPTELNFGENQLTLIPFPGHSECTMIVKINDQFIHVSDEVMFSNEGEPIIPGVDNGQTVERHLDSLKRLQEYTQFIFIPAHGKVFSDRDLIEKDIQNRMTYLRTVLDHEEQLTYEEATKDCDCEFLHSEWHQNVYE